MPERAASILIQPMERSEGFLAYAIGIEGCVAEGRTEEETLANLKAAIAEQRRRRDVSSAAATA